MRLTQRGLPIRWVLLLCLLLVLGCGVKQKGPTGQAFELGRQDVLSGEFESGIQRLERFLDEHHGHDLAVRANFLIAKAHLGLGDYAAAKQWFNHVIEQHPATEEAHKAKFKLAMLSVLQGDREDARQRLESLRMEAGPYAPEVVAWLEYLEAAGAAE